MKSLKQIINRYIRSAAIVMALVILVVIAFAEILIEQGRVEDTAAGTFVRLEQIIEENENELKQVKEKYDKTCLHDAEAIAFLLQKDPEATSRVKKQRHAKAAQRRVNFVQSNDVIDRNRLFANCRNIGLHRVAVVRVFLVFFERLGALERNGQADVKGALGVEKIRTGFHVKCLRHAALHRHKKIAQLFALLLGIVLELDH